MSFMLLSDRAVVFVGSVMTGKSYIEPMVRMVWLSIVSSWGILAMLSFVWVLVKSSAFAFWMDVLSLS